MLLKGRDGSEFALTVLGYELLLGLRRFLWPFLRRVGRHLPARRQENWLVIRIRVKGRLGTWTARHASVTNWEIDELARWLEGVAAGRTPERWEPLEPTIAFECIGGSDEEVTIRVILRQELAPPWIKEFDMRDNGVPVDLRLHRVELTRAAASLL